MIEMSLLLKKAAYFTIRKSAGEVLRDLHNWRWNQRHGKGTEIMAEDWDNLIILDACRYDELNRLSPFEAPEKKKTTLGARTPKWLRRNFLREEYFNTVYVTANPQTLRLENGEWGTEPIFHALRSIHDQWDEDTHTVLPYHTKEAGLKASEEFPNKRLIIHFNQPHYPYIGKTAQRIEENENVSIGGLQIGEIDYIDTNKQIPIDRIGLSEAINGKYDISLRDLKKMYRETLQIALEEVQELVENLEGKTVISADHGEMFGEKPSWWASTKFGHPFGWRTDELCIVPWVEIKSERRKEIRSDPPLERNQYDQDTINKRLNALGYR